MTGPALAEAGDDDELAEAAARERADGLAAHRRLRAWLLAASASAGVVLLAVTAVSLMGWRVPSPDSPREVPTLAAISDEERGRRIIFELDGIFLGTLLPGGWSSTGIHGSATGPVSLMSEWRAPTEATAGPQVVEAVLTRRGWQRCASDLPRSECWRLGSFQLILAWGPGDGCPTRGPCWRATVVLSDAQPLDILDLPTLTAAR